MKALIRYFFGWYFEQFRPDFVVNTICDVNPLDYRFSDIKALISDADNTLLGGGETEVKETIREYLLRLALPTVIVSNVIHRTEKRLDRLANIAKQVNAVGFLALGFWQQKPSPLGVEDAISRLHIPPENVAVVGDLLTTDILAAKRTRANSRLGRGPLAIWTRIPIGHQERHIRYLRRPFERLIVWVLEI